MAKRQGLEEEYRERVMRAVGYIEANLDRPFSLEEAAREAAWSFFHFHRLFQSIVGMPPGEYLRGRRLALAARLLAAGGPGLAEVARATGFGSAEALSRSFKSSFGTTPGEYRRRATTLSLMNPFGPNERPIIRPSPWLLAEPRVEAYGPLRLAGLRKSFLLEDSGLVRGILAFWEASMPVLAEAGGWPRGQGPRATWEIAEAEPGREGEAILLFAGVEPGKGRLPAGVEEFDIPRSDYLLALHQGPASALNETYLYLYGAWLPRMGLRPGLPMDFAFFGDRYDRADPESAASVVEFRIPLG